MVAGLIAVTVFALLATLVPASAAPRSAPSKGATLSAAATASTQNRQGTIKSEVHGTFGTLGKVTGTFHPERFMVQNGKVYGVGMLNAKLSRGGTIVGHVHRQVALPLKGGSGTAKTCDILDLVLGPLHLNLLGLHVDLNKVILHITAVAGAASCLATCSAPSLICSTVGRLTCFSSPTCSTAS